MSFRSPMEEDEYAHRIKRNRKTLACTACSKRKIKCDKVYPCSNCVKKGDPAGCDCPEMSGEWRGIEAAEAPQPGPSRKQTTVCNTSNCTSHREDLERRLSRLEQVFDYPSTKSTNTSEPVEYEDSDTEDAALHLEDIAAVGFRGKRISIKTERGLQPFNATASTSSASTQYSNLLVPPIAKSHKALLASLYSQLPESKLVADWLIGHYFTDVDWGWHLHHTPTFLEEYRQFGLLLDEGRRSEIDPIWLAILFLTLASSLSTLEVIPEELCQELSEGDLKDMPAVLLECARSALDCGEWCVRPQLRTIQAITLMGPYLLYCGLDGAIETLATYTAIGVRHCQQLGLHRLASSVDIDPTLLDDIAVRGRSVLYCRETALRLLHSTLFLDQIIFRYPPILPLSRVTAPRISNYEDADLQSSTLYAPRPFAQLTVSSHEGLRFELGRIQRAYHQQVIEDKAFDYATVMAIDREIRSLLSTFPMDVEPAVESQQQLCSRLLSLQNIHIRLMRFHRPFMSRGFREMKYASSTTLAIEAARNVLILQQRLSECGAPLLKSVFQLLHIQAAVVVLFMPAWSGVNIVAAPTAGDIELIKSMTPFFTRFSSSLREQVSKVALQSTRVLAYLLQALHDRNRGARADESYASLLKRVGQKLSGAPSDGEQTPAVPETALFTPFSEGAYALPVETSPPKQHEHPAEFVDVGDPWGFSWSQFPQL